MIWLQLVAQGCLQDSPSSKPVLTRAAQHNAWETPLLDLYSRTFSRTIVDCGTGAA
jgi:hypothetical protein